jgi:hypothetical protein
MIVVLFVPVIVVLVVPMVVDYGYRRRVPTYFSKQNSRMEIPPVHLAILNGRADALKRLIKAGCDSDVNQTMSGGGERPTSRLNWAKRPSSCSGS